MWRRWLTLGAWPSPEPVNFFSPEASADQRGQFTRGLITPLREVIEPMVRCSGDTRQSGGRRLADSRCVAPSCQRGT
jgi:hypothetical protein